MEPGLRDRRREGTGGSRVHSRSCASSRRGPGGAADVVAPIDGRLTRVVEVPLGASVSRGQELARLLPPPSVPGDLPQLQRARAEAQSALALATRDRERAERLTSAGAAPGEAARRGALGARNRPRPVSQQRKPVWRSTTPRGPAARRTQRDRSSFGPR